MSGKDIIAIVLMIMGIIMFYYRPDNIFTNSIILIIGGILLGNKNLHDQLNKLTGYKK